MLPGGGRECDRARRRPGMAVQAASGAARAVIYDPPYIRYSPMRGREARAAGSVAAPFSFMHRTMSAVRPGRAADGDRDDLLRLGAARRRRLHRLDRRVAGAAALAWCRSRPGVAGCSAERATRYGRAGTRLAAGMTAGPEGSLTASASAWAETRRRVIQLTEAKSAAAGRGAARRGRGRGRHPGRRRAHQLPDPRPPASGPASRLRHRPGSRQHRRRSRHHLPPSATLGLDSAPWLSADMHYRFASLR